jgi:arginyl-tRNA synthetase
MKISIDKVRITPNNIKEHCAVYVITDEILEWIDYHGLQTTKHEKGYLNIFIDDLEYRWQDLFSVDNTFTYFDGFSPNLNKSLHLGHLSNLVYASAISNLCPHLSPVSILNDTDDHKDKELFYEEYKEICKKFNYKRERDFFSSEMQFVDFFEIYGKLFIQDDDFADRYIKEVKYKVFVSNDKGFENCIVVETPKTKQAKVIVKSDGSTNYLNQDLAFAKKLHLPILYLTGAEQISHFEIVNEFYPKNKHLAIGLITTDKEKMSSRLGNVVYLKDILEQYGVNTLKDTFLSYHYKTFKDNLKIEQGLSKHFKKLAKRFENKKLYLVYLNAQNSYNPSLLYKTLINESKNDIDYGLQLLGYERH